MGISVLEIDRDFERSFLAPELRALSTFSPDVVVDDFSFTTAHTTRLKRVPRVSVLRKGVFPGDRPRKPGHVHSGQLEWLMETWPLGALGLPRPKEASELFVGKVNIIPSIPSVEPLPEPQLDERNFIYSGPLRVDDTTVLANISAFDSGILDEVERGWGASLADFLPVARVEEFLGRHRGSRPIAYLTIGLARHANLAPFLPGCIDLLLDRGAAVVTNVEADLGRDPSRADRYLYSAFLPMDLVCSRCDLMIHQCGSGTYAAQIDHRLPAITLGTMCYDREDVALRLEELGASVHVVSPAEDDDFLGRFSRAVDLFLGADPPARAAARAAVSKLSEETAKIREGFDFRKVLEAAVTSA